MQNIKIIFWLLFFGSLAFFLKEVSPILTPFIASIIIAYFLNPLTIKLEKLGIKRTLTVSIIVGIFFTGLITGLLKLIPVLFEQIKQFIAAIPQYEQYVSSNILIKIESLAKKIDPRLGNEIHSLLSNISAKFFEYFLSVIRNVFNSSMAVLSLIGIIFFTPILVFYLLKDWPSFVKNVHKLLPLSQKKLILEQFKLIDSVLSSYIRGQINVCLILSTFYVISLSILGLNYSLLVGIIAGFLVTIPYVGFIVGCSICSLVALLQFSDLTQLYITLAIFFIGNLFEGYVITPKLVGDKVGLHPVWIIFSLMAGGCLFGFWGMFFAIPIASITGVLLRSMIKIYLNSKIYH
jgi:putative permease